MQDSPNRGTFIVIEGIDGTGKSTQVRMLAEALRADGHEVVQSFEPTNGQYGKVLRESASTGRLSIDDELDLFLKDRAEHLDQLILPALAEGKIVILDRYYFSTMAYQGARGLDPTMIREKNEAFAPQPDLLLILDLDVESAHQRIGLRGDTTNDFEKAENLRRCRDIFLSLKPEPFARVVPSTGSIEEIHSQLLDLARSQLKSASK